MVRNEADIIGLVIANLLDQGVDRLIVADNCSTDYTRTILEAFDEVEVVDDLEIAYYQSQKMTRLAHRAGEGGAEWIVPFDADEIWRGTGGRTVAEVLNGADADIVTAPTYQHIVQPTDPDDENPLRRIGWRSPYPQRLPKVAFRYRADVIVAQGNHDIRPCGSRAEGLEIREFQYRSFEQMAAKVRHGRLAYEATDLHPAEGAHWRTLGALDDVALRAEWDSYTGRSDLVYDPA